MDNVNVYDIVLSGDTNPIIAPQYLGVVLRKYENGFARKTAAVVIFENQKFCDCLEEDIDHEIVLTKYKTSLLQGVSFQTDEDITEAIKKGVFKSLFKTIREQLQQESNA